MSEDWCGFLELAIKLGGESGAAELRSAISRAYYSAFNISCEVAVSMDATFNTRGADPHARLWDWYGMRKTRIGARVKSEGRAGRDKRNDADYRPKLSSDLAREAEAAIKRAQTIIKLVRDPNL